jgi:hypothetical protein
MKTYKVTIKIHGLCGISETTHDIKAKTLKSAQKKAYAIIGNQSGQIVDIVG